MHALQMLFGLTDREMAVFDGKNWRLQHPIQGGPHNPSIPLSILGSAFIQGCDVIAMNCENAHHAEFEGDEYYKTEVRPKLEDGSAAHASIYVWQDSARHAACHACPYLRVWGQSVQTCMPLS